MKFNMICIKYDPPPPSKKFKNKNKPKNLNVGLLIYKNLKL